MVTSVGAVTVMVSMGRVMNLSVTSHVKATQRKCVGEATETVCGVQVKDLGRVLWVECPCVEQVLKHCMEHT